MNTAAALKVLIVVTSHAQLGSTGKPTGWYLPEVAHPYYALTAEGFAVDFASPAGGKAPIDPKSLREDDAESARFLADPILADRIARTLGPDAVDPKAYSAILYAGGHGTMWDFPNDAKLARIASSIYENGGVVAAVCHGPAALVNVRTADGKYLVSGKRVAAFTNAEESEAGVDRIVPFLLETKLRERGALVNAAANWTENVVVDGRLVTGQNPASASKLGREVARVLKSLPKKFR